MFSFAHLGIGGDVATEAGRYRIVGGAASNRRRASCESGNHGKKSASG